MKKSDRRELVRSFNHQAQGFWKAAPPLGSLRALSVSPWGLHNTLRSLCHCAATSYYNCLGVCVTWCTMSFSRIQLIPILSESRAQSKATGTDLMHDG